MRPVDMRPLSSFQMPNQAIDPRMSYYDDDNDCEEEEEKHNAFERRRLRPKLNQYRFVSSEKRTRLINLIEVEHMGIKEASQRLQLNYSTAKSILRKYRHTGKILSIKNEFFNDYQKIYQETTA